MGGICYQLSRDQLSRDQFSRDQLSRDYFSGDQLSRDQLSLAIPDHLPYIGMHASTGCISLSVACFGSHNPVCLVT